MSLWTMSYNLQHIQNLLLEKITGTISGEDNRLVEEVIANNDEVRELWDDICEKLHAGKGRKFLDNLDENTAWLQVEAGLRPRQDEGQVKRTRNRYWLSAAAVILIAFGISLLYLERKPADANLAANEKNGIRLKLANGKTIALDENTGSSIDLGNIKLNAGEKELSYTNSKAVKQEWSTLVVPVTRDYKIVLSDGTEVRLNAASSLRFPFNFPGSLREVYLDGEAYFKVAKNARQPFIVHIGNTEIHVLGTSFNVNAYSGDIASTSLVEGSVIAKAGDNKVILKPGFQTSFIEGKGFKTEPFDQDVVISWISGTYYFHDQQLSDIAETVQRWFGTKVVFQSTEAARHQFTGTIEKSKPLQVFVSNLQLSSDFQIELRQGILYIK